MRKVFGNLALHPVLAKALGQVYDTAWAQVSQMTASEAGSIEAMRAHLAGIILDLYTRGVTEGTELAATARRCIQYEILKRFE